MLPVHDVNPVRRTPWVTYALLLVNVLAFLASPMSHSVVGDPPQAQQCRIVAFLDEHAAKPDEVVHNRQDPPTRVVTRSGEPACPAVAPYDKKPFVSVLTAMFLHGGWLHLLGNMLFLYVFGNNVEDRLGRLRFLAFYLGCGYAATYGFSLLDADSTQPLVGASGAIAGVLGAYLVLFPRARVWSLLTFFFFLPVRLPAWLVLGSWFLLQYAYFRGAGVGAGGVAYGAHVIGFVAGAALVCGLRGSAQPRGLAAARWGPYSTR